MKDFPFDTVDLSAEDVDALEKTYKALKAKYNITLPDVKTHINKFELFNTEEEEASVNATFLIDYPVANYYLNFVKIRYKFTAGRSNLNYLKCQAWAFVNLKQDFGRVLIRTETFADRMLELINHSELIFNDDRAFNKHFYVIANDERKAVLAMTPDFLKVIKENMTNNLTIEIINHLLVIKNHLPIKPSDIIELVDFASKIGKSF